MRIEVDAFHIHVSWVRFKPYFSEPHLPYAICFPRRWTAAGSGCRLALQWKNP